MTRFKNLCTTMISKIEHYEEYENEIEAIREAGRKVFISRDELELLESQKSEIGTGIEELLKDMIVLAAELLFERIR